MKVRLSASILLECLEWIPRRGCTEVLVGDQIGNIYWLKLNLSYFSEQRPSSTPRDHQVLRFYEHAHSGAVLDIKYYLHNLIDRDTELFASGSFDGYVNVYDLQDGF